MKYRCQIHKMIFCIFYQVNLAGSGLLNRTGAEIGYKLDKKCKKVIFIVEKIQIYRKCPALVYSAHCTQCARAHQIFLCEPCCAVPIFKGARELFGGFYNFLKLHKWNSSTVYTIDPAGRAACLKSWRKLNGIAKAPRDAVFFSLMGPIQFLAQSPNCRWGGRDIYIYI